MSLLILLTALLTALTGVVGQARPQAPHAVAVAVAIGQRLVAAHPVAIRSARPAAPHPAFAQLAQAPIARGFSLSAPVPAFATRRRE